jgi:hypothetical protein
MSTSKYKLVYTDWLDLPSGKAPIANGMHPTVVSWMKDYAKVNPQIVPDSKYGRVYELESTYQTSGSGIIFHHINVFYYFKLFHGMENIVDLDQVDPNDDCVYFLPYELEGSNVDYISKNFNFTFNEETVEYNYADSLSPRILELLRSGKVKILLANLTEFSWSKDTLQSFDSTYVKLGIDPSNVNWLMGNTRLDYPGNIKQTTSHASLQQQAEIASRYPIERSSLGYLCDYPRTTELNPNTYRPKKFMSWNRAMNRPHRMGIAYLALKHDILKDGIFSFIHSPERGFDNLYSLLVNEQGWDIEKYTKSIIDMLPYEVDTQDLTEDGKMGFQSNENNKKEFYLDAYLHLTSETQFDQFGTPFMSEKTFRPILNLQPFIYFGNYRGLEELQRLGFKTFNGFVDESYDQEPIPSKRFSMIEKELKKFVDMSKEELHNWYYSLTDILVHNQQHFLTFKDHDPLKELFDRY